MLISLSTKFITYSTYSGPEQLVEAVARNIDDAVGVDVWRKYWKPGGNPAPASTGGTPMSQIIPQIKLSSL